MSEQTTNGSPRRDPASVGEVIDYVKAYAKQETVGPFKGAGKWIGFGAAGSLCLGLGISLLLLGLLRMLQTESFGAQGERWTWVNYLVVTIVCAIAIALTVWRVNKTFLNKEDKQ
jgi:hypothetical protein